MIAIRSAHRSRTAFRRTLGMMLTLAVALAPLGIMARAADAANKSAKSLGDDFEWSGKIAAGKAIEIKGINGGIEVEPTNGTEVKVSAEKNAHKSDPASVSIEVIEHDGGVTICAVYPTPKGERANECQPGAGGHMNTRNNDVDVEFRVQVPAGVRFVGRT
jgi:hypothetical protein